jgi:hypothetical protein
MRARIIKNSAKFGDFQEIWPVLDVFAVHSERYPLAGETRERHFIGTNSKPHKVPENAQTPTTTPA